MEKLTKLQLRCLMTWSKLQGKNRSMTGAALKLNVSRTAIQKALGVLTEQGFLDEFYELTQWGRAYVEQQEKCYHLLQRWMQFRRVAKEEWEDVYLLMAEMGPSFLSVMANEGLFCNICRSVAGTNLLQFDQVDLSRFLPPGTYEVDLEFRKAGSEHLYSMADKAFAKPGRLIVTDTGSELELRRLKILHNSPHKQAEVSGKMRTLEYYLKGEIKKPKVSEDLVKIPTADMTWSCAEDERVLTGRLEVTFTCTAGFHDKDISKAVMCVRIMGTGIAGKKGVESI